MKWEERPKEKHSYDWNQPVPKHLSTEERVRVSTPSELYKTNWEKIFGTKDSCAPTRDGSGAAVKKPEGSEGDSGLPKAGPVFSGEG